MNTTQSGGSLHQYIQPARRIVVFTGAGISTESGIRDYRSQGGIWQRFQPVTIQEFLSDDGKRRLYWQRKLALYEENKDARPNAGHQAVVKLEERGQLLAVITQNIDGLHRMAGTSPEKLLEIHGTNLEVICLSCGVVHPWRHAYERLVKGEDAPACNDCGGWLKPNTISFGQNLNPDILSTSFRHAADCDLMIVLGSSLVVEPAASIPRAAKEHGAKLVIITQSETPLDHLADLKITAPIGKTLGPVMTDPN